MKYTLTLRRITSILILPVFLTSLFASLIPGAYADNTTYYVDATSGIDGNNGTSTLSAWQSLDRVNIESLLPGDQILLKCGESWTGQLILGESGALGNPIVYGSYGTCTGSNDPIIFSSGSAPQITQSGTPSHIVIDGLSLQGGATESVLANSGSNNISVLNSAISNPTGSCMTLGDIENYTLSGNTLTSCAGGISIGSGSGTISGNTFSGLTSGHGLSVSLTSTGTRTIERNTFSSIPGSAIQFGQNTIVRQNIITSACMSTSSCGAIQNVAQDAYAGGYTYDTLSLGATITENIVSNTALGSPTGSYRAGLYLGALSRGVTVSDNTFSGGLQSVVIENGRFHTLSNNIFYNPRTFAVLVEENLATYTGLVQSNTFSTNTIHAYNPDYSMVRIDDRLDQNGTLATLSGNRYLNLYKIKSPVIELMRTAGDSKIYNKSNLTDIDLTGQNFTAFANYIYTSTGSYNGAQLLANGNFGAGISSWSTDVLTLSHNTSNFSLSVSQGSESIGTLSSNSFSVTNGARYEISGILKNTTNSEGHRVRVMLRKDSAPYTLYADRVIDVVATATGTNFLEYIVANTTASDARLDFIFENPNTDFELDTLLVRGKTGVNFNPRTNEVVLVSNPTGSATDIGCSLGAACSDYVSPANTNYSWNDTPINVGAYRSYLALWNNSPYVLRPPLCTLVPSNGGTVSNGQPISLTWSSTNALTNVLEYITSTGTVNSPVASSGSITFTPPPDLTSQHYFYATNDVGTNMCQADIVASNTPPIPNIFYGTGMEDMGSITGVLQAVDSNSGDTITFSKITDPTNGVIFIQPDGSAEYTSNTDFCGVDTFDFIARDQFNHASDVTQGFITVLCDNDPPVAIDDMETVNGNSTTLLSPLVNDTDPDMPYSVETLSISGFTLPTHGTLSFSGAGLAYTPTIGYVGIDAFTYTIQDQSGMLSNTGTVSITVVPVTNIPPQMLSGSFAGFEDGFITGTLSGTDANGDTLSFSASSLPTNGTLSLDGSGSFTYTPNPNFNGSDPFDVVAFDGQATSAVMTIGISVTSIPDAPIVQDDSMFVETNGSATLLIMQNDNDPDEGYQAQVLTITGYTLPTNGTLSIIGTGAFYTPTLSFSGFDSFTYSIADQDGNLSNTGTVNITVSPVNHPPVVSGAVFTGSEDAPIIASLSGTDQDGTPVNFLVDVAPLYGVLTLSLTGEMVYTPNANFIGTDSFTFHGSDGVLSSTIETVSITVTGVNDLPVANNDTATGTEDTPLLISTLLANDTDSDSGAILALASLVTPANNGTATLSGLTDVVYTPNANFCGTDMFTYNTQDEFSGISNTATVNVQVVCVNDPPILSDSSYTATGNIITSSGHVLTAILPSNDPDADILSFSLVSLPTSGTMSLSSSGLFTYVPNLGFSGTESFTYTAFDGFLSGNTVTGTITVNPNTYNVIPTSYDLVFTMNEDGVLTASFSGSDVEGDPLTFSLVGTGVTQGSLVASGSSFTYTPNANFHGSDSFTYVVSDPYAVSTPSTVSITINPINDAPIASTDIEVMSEDTTLSTNPLANDSDIDGDTLSITGTLMVQNGTAVLSGSTITYTPNANFSGTGIIDYSITDGFATSTAQVIITVTSMPDTPVGVDDILTLSEDMVATVLPLTNDSDPDGEILSIVDINSLPANGTAVLSGSTITYTPNANFHGSDSLTYRITDGTTTSSPIGVIITVNPINDIPSGFSDTGSTNEDTALLVPVLANDSDIDGDTLSISSISTVPNGSATISGSSILFTPSANFYGTSSFSYTLTDGTVTIPGISVSITVNPINDIPVAQNASYTLTGNIVISSGVILSGGTLSGYLESQNIFSWVFAATDIENNPLTYSLVGLPVSGTATLISATGGVFTYIPALNVTGIETLTFIATDGTGVSNMGTVNFCIISPNPNVARPACAPALPPVIVPINAGPGGGGGGGSSMSQVVFAPGGGTSGSSPSLISQLFLTRRSVGTTLSGSTLGETFASPYTALKTTLDTVITTTNTVINESPQDLTKLRKYTQKYIRSVVTSPTLTDTQKYDTLDTTLSEIQVLLPDELPERTYNAIQYIIRLFESKKNYLLPSIQLSGNLII